MLDSVFEVGECECVMDYVMKCSFFGFLNSKWEMDYVSEVGECECGMDLCCELK